MFGRRLAEGVDVQDPLQQSGLGEAFGRFVFRGLADPGGQLLDEVGLGALHLCFVID